MGPRPTPVLIGLPAAGKSSVSRELGKQLRLEVFASDSFFRESRALPKGSDDPRRRIMDRFLKRLERGNAVWKEAISTNTLDAIHKDAMSVDAKGRCPLADGSYFRRHGEAVFRTYEVEMLKWVEEKGHLAHRIPDLSGSASRFEEVRNQFSIENGYLPILIDPPKESIVRNLIQDYETILARRSEGNSEVTIRGNYETRFDDVLRQDPPTTKKERKEKLRDIATTLVVNGRNERMSAYHKHAVYTLRPNASATATALADLICQLVDR